MEPTESGQILEMIRDGSVSAELKSKAATGALELSPAESIQVLVALLSDREVGEQAEATLKGWKHADLLAVAADPNTPAPVLYCLLRYPSVWPALITTLCNNPAVSMEQLEALPAGYTIPGLKAMLNAERVRHSPQLLERIAENPLAAPVAELIHQWQSEAEAYEAERAAAAFIAAHAEEMKHEANQPFELVAAGEGEEDQLHHQLELVKSGEAAPEAAPEEERKTLGLLQRIANMRVGERIKLAMRGNREERMVLIRDRSKLVSLAVLESPKVNDVEMETFAGLKNIQEGVLRAIAAKRNYMKNYGVQRALINNPKSPLDIALPLLPYLQVKDLRGLSVNKNVNETIRKMAIKLFRAKTERKKEE